LDSWALAFFPLPKREVAGEKREERIAFSQKKKKKKKKERKERKKRTFKKENKLIKAQKQLEGQKGGWSWQMKKRRREKGKAAKKEKKESGV